MDHDRDSVLPEFESSSEHSTLVARLAEQLRESIIRGELPDGHRLKQSELAQRYGVSPIPIREAIRLLETEGFVEILPYKGAAVSHLSVDSLNEGIEIAFALHTHAMRLAIPRYTTELLEDAYRKAIALYPVEDLIEWNRRLMAICEILFDATHWPRLFELIRRNHQAGRRYTDILLTQVHSRPNYPRDYYPKLIRLLQSGDLDGAIRLTRERFDLFRSLVVPILSHRQKS